MPTQVNIQELGETWQFPDDATPEQIKQTVSRKLEQITLEEATPFARQTFPEAFSEPNSLAPVQPDSGGFNVEEPDATTPDFQPAISKLLGTHDVPDVAELRASDAGLWERFRNSEWGHFIFGPTDIEREAIATGGLAGNPGGQPGLVPIALSTPSPFLPGAHTKAGKALLGYFVANFAVNEPAKVEHIYDLFQKGDTQTAYREILGNFLEAGITVVAAKGLHEGFGRPLESKAAAAGRMLSENVESADLPFVEQPVSPILRGLAPETAKVVDDVHGGPLSGLTEQQQRQSNAVKDSPVVAQMKAQLAEVDASKTAEDLGVDFKPQSGHSTKGLKEAGMSEEQITALDKVASEHGWEFTPKPESPIAGHTFYTRKGATAKEITDAYNVKVREVQGNPTELEVRADLIEQGLKDLLPEEQAEMRAAIDKLKRFEDLNPREQELIDTLRDWVNEEMKDGESLPESTNQKLAGMGSARAGEVEPTGTKLSNAVGELERASHGLPEAFPTERRSMAGAWVRSGEKVAADPLAGKKLADELKHNPERGMTDDDSALLLRHKVDLENSKNQAAEDTITANTPEGKLEAQSRFDDLSNQLLDLLDAAKFRGSQWGREGRWRQALAFEDFSLETMRRDKRMDVERDLTSEETAEVKRLHERISELEKQVTEARSTSTISERTQAVEEAATETIKQPRSKSKGVERDLESEQKELVANLKERFADEGDVSTSQPSIRKLMELLVEREGITERLPLETRVHEILQEIDPSITREQAQDLMSGYGKSKLPSQEPAKKIVRDISAQIISVRKLLDYFKGQVPKLTGQLRDAPSDIQRGWIKMVNEAKKVFKLDVPVNKERAVKSALDAITTRLKNRLADLKQEVATRQKIIRERSPSPYNAETLRLRKEIEELQKQHDEIFGGKTDAEKLAAAERSAERQITELQRQIDSGEIFPKSKQAFGLRSDKLDAAKSRIEELKFQRQMVRESLQPKLEPQEAFLLNYELRLRQRAAEYRERLARGDFAKKPKPERETSPAILKALAEVETAKNEWRLGRLKDQMAKRSAGRKVWDGIQKTRGSFVNIASSFDFSAPRQALWSLLSNATRLVTNPTRFPKTVGRPFLEMFKAWSSERRAAIIEQRIKNRPNALSGADKTAGIEYSELNANKFTKFEENAHSVLDEWAALSLRTGNFPKTMATLFPKLASRGIRMSNRAFITFLNSTRASLFDELLRANYKDRAPTKTELELFGNYVNLATGRGKLSPITSRVASEVIWAPKLLASRVQLLTGQPLLSGVLSGKTAGTARARKAIAREYARVIMSGYLLWSVSRIFDEKDESNTTSSDFGKIVRGKTRIDPWAGFQQVTTLGARTATAKTTTLAGDENDIGASKRYGQRGLWYVATDFLRSKLRPDVAAAVDIATRTDVQGRPTTPGHIAESLLVPLPMRDITEIMKEHGFTEGMIIEALGQFGAGVSYYEDREAQK